MNFGETVLFYLVFGVAIAAAFALAERRSAGPPGIWSLVAACLFWPLYLPLILSSREASALAASPPPADDLSAAIEQVERELDAALAGLDGWAENVLNHNSGRIGELRAALTAQADRIRSMDALLAGEQAEPAPLDAPPESNDGTSATDDRNRRSRLARRENMQRLAEIHRRSRSEIMATFAWIRELVSMIHLAKFTGAPAARAEELVAQIAAAVESLSTAERL